MEPDAQLPRELEGGEGGAVVADDGVRGGIATPSHFTEELSDLARENALILEAAQEIELRFFAARIEANLCGHDLGEQLGELAELQEGGIWVLGEIALGEHTKADELVVVGCEMREIGARTCQLWSVWGAL